MHLREFNFFNCVGGGGVRYSETVAVTFQTEQNGGQSFSYASVNPFIFIAIALCNVY